MRLLFLVLALPLVACSVSLGESCDTDSDCRSNLVCFSWPCVDGERCRQTCEHPCETSDECPAGRVCSGMLCTRVGVVGDAGSPEDAGDGGSPEDAVDGGSPEDAGA